MEWLLHRPEDKFYNICISSHNIDASSLNFFRFHDGAMSTADPSRAKVLVDQGWELKDQLKIPSTSLLRLAKQIKEQFSVKIDFISIDLEMINFLSDLPGFLNLTKP